MNQKEAYDQGYRDALTALAVWKDGQQYVGVRLIPLKEALSDLNTPPKNE